MGFECARHNVGLFPDHREETLLGKKNTETCSQALKHVLSELLLDLTLIESYMFIRQHLQWA